MDIYKSRHVRPELEIFSVPQTEVSLNSSEYQPFYPLYSFKDNENPIEFLVSDYSTRYLDLYNSYLYIRANITKRDGTQLPAGEVVAPGNLFLHTMFKNCCVKVYGTTISDSSGWYPYQAWIQNQLFYGAEKKSGELSTELYYKDSSPDEYDPERNPGFKARMTIASESKSFEMVGRLETGLFQQRRYLPTKTPITVSLERNYPEFSLSCATATSPCPYKINVDEAILYIKMQELSPDLLSHHQKLFEQGKASIYPYLQSRIATMTIPTGSMGLIGQTVFSGQLPEIITIGVVTLDAALGALNKNPYNFAPNNLSTITLSVGMEQKKMKFDFSKNQYLIGYKSLFDIAQDPLTGNGIGRADYINGNVLNVFQMQPSYDGALHLPREGEVKLELGITPAATEALKVIIWGQFQNTMQIEKNRAENIITNL